MLKKKQEKLSPPPQTLNMDPQIESRLVLTPYVTSLTDCDATEQKVSQLCVGGKGHQKTAFTRLKLMFAVFGFVFCFFPC